MKKIEVKNEYVSYMYEAYDGTRFSDKEICKTYEEGITGTILARLKKCELNRGSEFNLFNGCDDNEIRIFNINSQSQIDDINVLYHIFNKSNEDNFIENSELVMLSICTYNNEIKFYKLKEFFNNIIGSKFEVCFKTKEIRDEHISDVGDLEYEENTTN